MKSSNLLLIAAVGAAAYLFLKKNSTTSFDTVSYGTDATSQENASSTGYLRTTAANQSTMGRNYDKTYQKTTTFSNATEGINALNQALAAGEKIDGGSRTIRKFSADTSVAVKLPSGKTETYSGGTITQLAGQSKPVYIGVKPKTIRK